MLESDDPLDIVQGLGESQILTTYPAQTGLTAETARNPHGRMLFLGISKKYLENEGWAQIPEWR